ncbi:unnamed protein product, partial [Ectocarpus sp. 13 AM-2016]
RKGEVKFAAAIGSPPEFGARRHAYLSCAIPRELGGLTALTKLGLSSNNLS